MIKVTTLTTAALILAMAPALAAATHYYVVRHPHSHRCSIVSKAPDGVRLLLVGSPHTSKSAATVAEQTSVWCTQRKKGG
jgi:hypothetical protein